MRPARPQRDRRLSRSSLAAACAAVVLGGCATFSDDGGFGAVRDTVRERGGHDITWPRTPEELDRVDTVVADRLSRPLGIDDAVQVALLNNRGLRAAYQDLGLAEAQVVAAGRLPNPHFSMMRASGLHDGVREYKIEQALTINLMALVTMPQALAIERRRFEAAQRGIALEVLRVASETRKAWVQAVAAQQTVAYMRQVRQAADASAELARRMAQAGNFNRLQQAREQGFYADAALGLARAERASTAARERLVRLMGLWGNQVAFRLQERLPDLPASADELPDVERTAMAQRLDLAGARIETEALARNLGLARTTRFINVLEFGPARIREGERGSEWKRGYEIAFELPLFDWGGARVAQAQSLYLGQLERVAQAAIDARSEVRDAYGAYRSAHDVARHYRDEIVPLRKRISDENLLRYNGMLIGVFDLLADARAQIAAVNASIEALRDFWLTEADLRMSLIGRPAPAATVAASVQAPDAGGPGH